MDESQTRARLAHFLSVRFKGTHRMSKSVEYRAWHSMRMRCRNPNNPRFKHYGARGITICERWASFENFFADMGSRPHGRSLDRINNDGNYEPNNCRWATASQQAKNRRLLPRETPNAWAAQQWRRDMTHCLRGHELTSWNLTPRKGWRECRRCKNDNQRLQRDRRKLRMDPTQSSLAK
jgi:hypothetical protein